MGATPLNGGNWGLLGCGGASSGVDPSAEGCVKGATAAQPVPLDPGGPRPRKGRGPGGTVAAGLPALRPPAGLWACVQSAPAGARPLWAGLLRGGARPEGLPYWADGQGAAWKEEEGGGRA